MNIRLGLILIFTATAAAFASAETVPVRWLEGERGYNQALEMQKKMNVPVLVWATWHECPYCGQVTALLNKPAVRRAIQDYPHVIIDEHGRPQEAAFAKEKGFHGGCFYIISPALPQPKEQIWAWKGQTREIIDDLEGTLAAKLAAAKPQAN